MNYQQLADDVKDSVIDLREIIRKAREIGLLVSITTDGNGCPLVAKIL